MTIFDHRGPPMCDHGSMHKAQPTLYLDDCETVVVDMPHDLAISRTPAVLMRFVLAEYPALRISFRSIPNRGEGSK